MKGFRLLLIVAIGIPAALVAARTFGQGNAAAAQETQGCSTASLKGGYSMAGQGFLGRAPLAFVGVLEFDGAGKFSGHHEESIGGNYGPSREAGDYSVRPDCVGVTHWTDHPPHTGLPPHNHTIAFVVTQGGNEVSFLGIDNSPPGSYHTEIPEPDIEFWGTLKKL